jgi:RNA polymerase sigma factor (sigma-70 family)
MFDNKTRRRARFSRRSQSVTHQLSFQMSRKASDSYSFLIETIKRLPVIASQDQEFWLAAAISCREVLDCAANRETSPECNGISVALLSRVFDRCIDSYDKLKSQLHESRVPSWNQLLFESLEARERIFQFRESRLFRCLRGPYKEEPDKPSATKIAVEIAQCLSVFPLGFLRHWRSSLENHGRNPSTRAALLYLLDVDCAALLGSIETVAFKARQTLVEGYLRYGLRMALGYVNMGIEYADLVQEAALGLVSAAEKYVYLEHGRFTLFATVWMWQHITRSLANDSRLIRLPVNFVQKRQDLQKQLAQYLHETGHTGSLAALIENKGLDLDECLPVLTAGVLPVRLDSPSPRLTRQEMAILLTTSANSVFQVDTYNRDVLIDAVLRELSPQQRDVISLRFGLYADEKEHTLDEIGRAYDLTRERIRQVEKKALEKLSRVALRGVPFPPKDTRSTNHNLRVPDAIDCDEALYPAHPYMPDDRHKMEVMLNSSFGTRQSIARQGLTIKGRILAAFGMYGTPLHTREIYEGVQVLYPFEQHLEATLYSTIVGSPGTFVSLGEGVFGLTKAEGSVVTEHKEPDGIPVDEVEAELLLGAQTDSDSISVPQKCKPESLQFPLQAMQRIFEKSEDFREKGNWSMAEPAWTLEDQAMLAQWAQVGTVDFRALTSQRILCRGSSFTGMECLGVTFLALCSDIAQKSAAEGDLWSHVGTSLGPQLRRTLFGVSGFPRRSLREATEEVCRKLKIRHAFGREGEQSWLRTVFLQIGLSKSGYNRLPFWLGQGALPPVAVQDLIRESSKLYSRTFSSLWMVLQRYRWGSLEQQEAESALMDNAWIRAEDRRDILAASVSQREIEHRTPDQESSEERVTASSVLTEPRLRWTSVVPGFEIGLQPNPPAWMDGERYILTITDQRVAILRTGAEWRIDIPGGTLAVEPIQPVLQANIIQRGVPVLESPLDILLTPKPDPFGIYDLPTGRRIDPAQAGRDFRRPTAILCREGITMLPPSKEFYRAFQGDWVFWAFREGLPPDFEIRDGELVIWNPDWAHPEGGTAIARSKKLAVSSFGGWWGETVRVSVAAPPSLQLLRVRLGSQRVELAPIQPGRFQGKLPLVAGDDYSANAHIECISEGRLERRIGDPQISEINGVALETENGWKPFDRSLDIDIEYFKSRRILVRLPSNWEGEERQPEDWVFLEGDHFCQRYHRSVSSLRDSLYGVGEPLVLSIGPYNYSSQGRKLTRGLLNSGAIRWVSREHEHWELQLRHSLDLGEGHEIWVWLVGEDSPRQLSRDQWSQRENVCEVRAALDQSPEGFAISYEGVWLGARTASFGLTGLQLIIKHTPSWPASARWLRWWRAPLLHESLKTELKTTAEADPVNTLAAWLTTAAPRAGIEYSDSCEDAWLSVVRGALWRWHPTPEQSRQAILSLGMMTGNPEIDLGKCWSGFEPILAANPMLLAQLSVSGIAEIYSDFSPGERQILLRMLQALILGLDRNAADADLKSTQGVCLTEAAESMNNSDPKFLTNSLLPMALRSVEGKLVQDLNLRIALANSPFRKWLAVALIQHATGEQPIRTSS